MKKRIDPFKSIRPPELSVSQTGDWLTFRGMAFQAVFDTQAGTLHSLDYGHGQLLEHPLKPVIRFADLTPDLRLARVLRSHEGDCHCLTCFYKASKILGHLICRFQIDANGAIAIEAAVRPRKPLIAFDLDEGYEKDQPLPAGQIHKLSACITRPASQVV